MDELFETMTLITTHKMKKKMPLVLFGSSYWDDVLNLDAMIEQGAISVEEAALIFKIDSVDAAFNHISADLEENALNDADEVVSPGMRGDS